MINSATLEQMRNAGIIFDGAEHFITEDNRNMLAQDAMITAPNAGVPAVFTSYVDSKIIEILLAPKRSREILPEAKKGDWTNDFAIFRTVEATGTVTPYSDYGNGASADVNIGFPTREQFIGQTTITYGDLEQERTARAMLDLVSRKQISAATIIDTAENKINLLGVEGMEIYGLINDPNIPAALTPAEVDSQTAWTEKNTQAIYDDILSLYGQIISASKGNVSQNDSFALCVSPTASVLLGKATDFNVSVKKMLLDYAPNTKIVVLPELESKTSGDSVMLVAQKVMGNDAGQFGYSEKIRAMRLIPKTSSYEQKFAFGTYGCVLYYPFAVAKMTGVTSAD